VQIMIDTATDSPEQLYRISTFLRSLSETPPAAALGTLIEAPLPVDPMNAPVILTANVMPSLPPAPPSTIADIVSDDDVEVEIDDAGNVTALTTAVGLPAAPPPISVDVTFHHTATSPLPPATPAPPGPAVSAELDKRGFPWDSRIHALNRAKKLDGSWKNKRGVDANLVTACEAQNKPGNMSSAPNAFAVAQPAAIATVSHATGILATLAAPTVANIAPPPPPLLSPTAGAAVLAAAAPTVANIAPPPPPLLSPTAGAAVLAAVVPAAIDFRGLMQKIQKATADGKLTADQVTTILAGIGLKPEEMAQLINNTPLIASVNAAVDKCLAS
jgi:hypothetical protein